MSNEDWIKKVHAKFPNRFDTSKTLYINSYHKVTLRCIQHNIEFECDPVRFLRSNSKGNFCPECQHNKKLTSQEFNDKAYKNYNGMYDLSKMVFKTTRDDVVLGCSKHGEFKVAARYVSSNDTNILCPECRNLINNKGHLDYVKRYSENKELGEQLGEFYKLKFTHKPSGLQFIKVGITSVGLSKRFHSKQYKDFDIEVLETIVMTNLECAKAEKAYQDVNFKNKVSLPDDLYFEGKTECYVIDELQTIKSKDLKTLRDSVLRAQDGVCLICKKVPKLPVVDHWHTKKNSGDGKIRGVLCSSCNVMVAVVENNLVRRNIDYSDAGNWLRNLADYLENGGIPILHPTEREYLTITRTDFNKLNAKFKIRYPRKAPLKYPNKGRVTKKLLDIMKEFE